MNLASMNKFFREQKEVFVNSLKIREYFKLLLIELLKYFSIAFLIMLALIIFSKLFINMQPLLNIVDAIRYNPAQISESTYQALLGSSYLFNSFMAYLAILLILVLASFILLNSLFDGIIIKMLRVDTTRKNLFVPCLKQYAPVISTFFIISALMIYYVTNVMMIFISLCVLSITYFYIMTIFQSTITAARSFKENLTKSLLNGMLIVEKVMPIFVTILAVALSLIVAIILIAVLRLYAIVPILFLLLSARIWMKNYFVLLCTRLDAKHDRKI